MSKQAMEKALDALINSRPINADSVIPHNKHCEAIAELKEAIKQHETFKASTEEEGEAYMHGWFDGNEAIKTQSEPVQCNQTDYCAAQFQKLYTSAPSIPEGYQLIRSDVVEFLNGSGELDGMNFGDAGTGKSPSPYWWRVYLSAAPEYKGEEQ